VSSHDPVPQGEDILLATLRLLDLAQRESPNYSGARKALTRATCRGTLVPLHAGTGR
jgi:hypothetical protein